MKQLLFFITFIACFIVISGCQDDRIQFPPVQSSPDRLNFTSSITIMKIDLFPNVPASRWVIIHKPDWIQVDRFIGTVGDGPIIVTALTSMLLPQTLTDKIVIKTVTGDLTIPVSVTITLSTAIQIAPVPLYIDYYETFRQFTITNSGIESAAWQLEPSAQFFSVSPTSGTLSPGESSTLTLTVNRDNLESTTYSENLTLKLGGATNSQAPVVINNFNDDKWALDGPVTDAEYDRTGDNLIVIIEDKLYKLKPETKTSYSVALPLPGNCVSVSKDGKSAVVGHDSSISLVNLTTMKIDKTYSTSADALDVVLAPNNWAYVFPKGAAWDNVRCIDLAAGTEVLSTGSQIYAGAKAMLHPSGDYIYTADNGRIPDDAQKLDIRGGRANFLYDSRYHGEHEFEGDLWMDGDGARMFTRGGDVYNLSTDPSSDMVYVKSLGTPVQTLDHSALKNMVCAIHFDFNTQSPKNEVRMFSGDLLNDLGTKPLPDFLVGQAGQYQIVPSQGVYGFFNAAGTRFHVCVRSEINSSSSEIQWAVATVNLD